MSANFSDLQSVDTVNDADQMMLRLNNGATGPDGFARIALSALNSAFTSNLTASDTNFKQLSAQWNEAYSLTSSNSSVFALTVANSANWDTAYFALTTNNYPYGNKVFDNIIINGPASTTRAEPVLLLKRDTNATVDMIQVMPKVNSSMFRITTAGQVGINIDNDLVIAPDTFLYVAGNQRIDGYGGNALTVNGDLFVNGSLSALSATYINSIVTNTSALSVTNDGNGPALFVRQTGVQPTVTFNSDAATITFADNGNITGFSSLSGSGRIIVGTGNAASNSTSYILGSNNNDNNLANVVILGSNISASVANYTYVQNLSATGIIAAGDKTSSDWNNAYSTINAQSAANASVFSSFNAQSAANASVYTSTNSNSATWSALSTIFNVVSAANTSALTAIGTNTNINAALVAKGTGATLAQIPDSTTAGGNARGQYATDFQKFRSLSAQVASGNYSVIAGGYNNTASGNFSVIAGGYNNTASGENATIAGGDSNTATFEYTTVCGGESNTATREYATIAGGFDNDAAGQYSTIGGGINNSAAQGSSTVAGGSNNIASSTYSTIGGGVGNEATGLVATVAGGYYNQSAGQYSTVAGGNNNIASSTYSTVAGGTENSASNQYSTVAGGQAGLASGEHSTIGGGYSNKATGDYSTVVGGAQNSADGLLSTCLGYGASANNYSEFAIGGGFLSVIGDNKSSTILARTTTTNAGSAFAFLNGTGGGESIKMSPNSTFAYTATIVGLSSHSDTSGLHYILRGLAKCNGAGNVTLYNTSNDLASRVPATLNASMSASGNTLRIVVYTPSAAIHYWTARVQAEYLQF